MKSSKATQARAQGKAETQARIVWQLDAGRLKVRCLAGGEKADGSGESFLVEAFVGGRCGVEVARGDDAIELLRKLVKTPYLAQVVSRGVRIVKDEKWRS